MVKVGEPLHRGEQVQHVGGPESLTVSSSTASNNRHFKTGICWSELYSTSSVFLVADSTHGQLQVNGPVPPHGTSWLYAKTKP